MKPYKAKTKEVFGIDEIKKLVESESNRQHEKGWDLVTFDTLYQDGNAGWRIFVTMVFKRALT